MIAWFVMDSNSFLPTSTQFFTYASSFKIKPNLIIHFYFGLLQYLRFKKSTSSNQSYYSTTDILFTENSAPIF